MILLLTKLAQMEIDEMNGLDPKAPKKKRSNPKKTLREILPSNTDPTDDRQ